MRPPFAGRLAGTIRRYHSWARVRYNRRMYQEIAPYYDRIFIASDAAVSFLERRCPPGGAALDVACGTGSHALELARRSRRVVGIDLDASMIELAKKKVACGDVEFVVGDMTTLEGVPAARGPFDLVYCIGNSLVHLPDRGSVTKFLESAARRCVAGGSIVIQIINFERIRSGEAPALPPLTSDDGRVEFRRRYEVGRDGSKVDFVTRLLVDGESIHTDSITLLTIMRDELVSMLVAAGFTECVTYGGFDGSEWTADSFVTLVSAVGRSE